MRTKPSIINLPPQVNIILFIRNLPFKSKGKDLYDIFGQYGSIRQIRRGNTVKTRGTAFVVYNDIFDAKKALESLNGFQIGGRFLICLYYQKSKHLQNNSEPQK